MIEAKKIIEQDHTIRARLGSGGDYELPGFEATTKNLQVTLKEYHTELTPGKTTKLWGIHYQLDKNKSNNKNKKVIMMCHGNAGNAFDRHFLGLELTSITGYDVFIASYPGYGVNEGKIQYEQDFYKATEAAYLHLKKDPSEGGLGYQEKNTILLSCSLGGGANVNIAAQPQYNPHTLALVAPFTSVPDFRWWIKPFAYPIARYSIHNLKKIDKVTSPILIAHDPKDPVIPYNHSQKLYTAIKEKNKTRNPVKVKFISKYNGRHFIRRSFIKELKAFTSSKPPI